MKQSNTYSLQRTMIVYFLLIGFASLMVAAEFVMETHSGKWNQALKADWDGIDDKETVQSYAVDSLQRIRTKAMMMVGVILAVVVIVLTMFIKTITEPLQHMVVVSQAICGGDLSKTSGVRMKNELSQLSAAIDDMSTNLQEIIMLSRSVCDSSKKVVEIAKKQQTDSGVVTEGRELLNKKLVRLEAELTTLGSVIDLFKLYSVDGMP